jgi:hypothetical protein
MKIVKKLFFVLIVLSFTACDDMLEPALDGTLTEDAVWSNNNLAFGFLNNTYNNLPNGYNRISNAMLDAATDDAVCPNPLSAINGFNNGTWSPFNVIENVWNKNYDGIRKANMFLAKVDDVPLPKKSNALGTDESILNTRKRMKGEARFLRAFFYFELVKRYGSVPLTETILSPEEAINLPRSSADACFKFIISECDLAAALLPTKYGASPAVVGFNEAKDIGRATSGAALALKSRALLYWASPLFNENNDASRWDLAAKAANAVINYTINADGTGSKAYNLKRFDSNINLSTLFSTNAVLPLYHDEIIFSTKYENNTTIESLNAPISFGAQGLTNPTQNLVEAFPMNNGKPITDPTSGYNPNNPFVNRDPRLSMTVLANNTAFSVNDKAGTIETFVGGIDGSGSYPNATHTGYYLQKFIMPYAVWDGRSVNVTRTWILFRIAEMYLNYAEARNEAVGPDVEVYNALKALRFRAGFRPVYVPIGLTKSEMRKFIQNERRIEFAFEEHRFFDVRRWKLFDNASERDNLLTIRGVKITKNSNGTLTYDTSNLVEQRIFTNKMYLYPIEDAELMKSNALIQNPGW